MTRTVAILGPGAVGGTFAVRLSEAHHRTICVGTAEIVGLMALSGITLDSNGSKPVNVRPIVTERLVEPVSLLLVTVKAPFLADALERIEPEAVEHAVVLPLLNGLEHMEPIRVRFPGRVAAASLSQFEAYRVGRMQIVQGTPSGVVTMASNDLSAQELERAADILRSAGMQVELEDDEKRVLWRKAARAAVVSSATALSRKSVGELRTDPEWRPRMEQALTEACAVATADGVKLMPSAQWTRIVEMDPHLTTSAARDVLAGKRHEIDAIAGSVVRAGERLGVPCPVLARLVAQADAL
ncbi:MAG: ketopantoate reductase family protein [Actinobacteria bacterium]|nr:ketopantoate reductase family protein [Actinomycetota bacterium]MBA3566263.1 ketopantoate reductase family protein [Actinomycetota bacterium]